MAYRENPFGFEERDDPRTWGQAVVLSDDEVIWDIPDLSSKSEIQQLAGEELKQHYAWLLDMMCNAATICYIQRALDYRYCSWAQESLQRRYLAKSSRERVDEITLAYKEIEGRREKLAIGAAKFTNKYKLYLGEGRLTAKWLINHSKEEHLKFFREMQKKGEWFLFSEYDLLAEFYE